MTIMPTATLTCGPRRERCTPGLSPIERVQTIGWDVDPLTGCWNWRGERGAFGRARLPVGNGRRAYPYRVTYEHVHGPIPDGLVACHTCDNPSCINPDHIQAATQQQNVAMIPRDRKGKLSDGECDSIRFLYATGRITQMQLARAYMVDQKTVSQIVRAADRSE